MRTMDDFNDNCTTKEENKEWFPNTPHPSLEYPLFYFILKCFPSSCTNWIRNLYTIRWELTYPLQKRLPFSKKLFGKIGISLTWGEFLLWTPFIVILVMGMLSSFVNPSVAYSGVIARLPLIVCFLTANHNSLLTLFLGIPFDRALKYHKASGYCAFINGIFHAYIALKIDMTEDSSIADSSINTLLHVSFDGQVNTSGSLLLILIVSMIITALPTLRRRLFEVFYYFHIIFSIAMTVCAFYHSGVFLVIIVSVLWGGDLFIRKVIMVSRYPRKVNIKRLSDTTVELSFTKTKNFDYNSGQYMYIAIPELSIFQWHPFSLSSSPYQQLVTFHIKKSGDWTSALHDLSENEEKEITIWLEGPYGSLSVNLTTDKRYKMALLFSGGIGVTPMQSICNQLLYEDDWNERDLKKLCFIWTSRDLHLLEHMEVVKSRHHLDLDLTGIDISSTQIIPSYRPSTTNVSQRSLLKSGKLLGMIEELSFIIDQDEDKLERELHTRDFMEQEEKQDEDDKNTDVSLISDTEMRVESDVVSIHCHVTQDELNNTGILSEDFIHTGRPDIKKIFLNMRQEAIKAGEKRVAVCVCAPKALVQICKIACIKYSNRKVVFDFHSEVFE